MIKLINTLKAKWEDRKEARFLAKHNCSSRKEYDRLFDPGYSPRCNRIKDMYHGYNYLIAWEPWTYGQQYNCKISNLIDWCDSNCKSKFRYDWHRVMDGPNGFEENGISGRDVFFFAFTSEEDAVMFNLRWL